MPKKGEDIYSGKPQAIHHRCVGIGFNENEAVE